MSNPYQSPAFDPKQFQDQTVQMPAGAGDYGWVSQVRIFAILNAVQGGLEMPMGLMLIGAGAFFPAIMAAEKANNPGANPSDGFLWVLVASYLTIGSLTLIGGLLRIVACFYNFSYRGRGIALASMIAGMASTLTCYCFPTSLAVLIYGLILHMNPAVKQAFEMGAQADARRQDSGFVRALPPRVSTVASTVGPTAASCKRRGLAALDR